MSKPASLEARIKTLEDIEAIKRLKCKYWRCVDRKLWNELAECFTEDAVADYGPRRKCQGRQAIIQFLKQSLGQESSATFHMGHNAEIEITGDNTARGTWVLNDYIVIQSNTKRKGWGFYDDEYVRENDQWKKKATKMTVVFEEWEPSRG